MYENQTTLSCRVTKSGSPETDPRFVSTVWEGELEVPEGRPAGQKIEITYAFDNNGMMRALNYPVGSIAGPMATDFNDPGGVRNSAASELSPDAPGLGVRDARSPNYNKFNGSIDSGGEARTPPVPPLGASIDE